MLKSEVLKLIGQGEGAKLEFKRDDEHSKQLVKVLAKAIVAFANMNGGKILLGVEDDGKVSGIQRGNLQEWLMDTVIGRYVHPFILPDYEEVDVEGKRVAVVTVPQGTSKPYFLKDKDREDVYVRYGNVCKLAGLEQLARLLDSGGLLAAETFPVHGSSIEDLDERRYVEYFERVLKDPEAKDWGKEDWQQILFNQSFLVGDDAASSVCSYFAYALFAKRPGLRLPKAEARITIYPGEDKDYHSDYDEVLDAPFVGFRGENYPTSQAIEPTLHERLIAAIKRHFSKEELQGTARRRFWDYPPKVVRELIINALVHRDWTKSNYVRVTVYSNRLEVTSPGGLPNGLTIEKIKSGAQVSRNPQCVRIFRNYEYLEDEGMGIRRKVIPLMREHNGTEPEFEDSEHHFKVTLWKK